MHHRGGEVGGAVAGAREPDLQLVAQGHQLVYPRHDAPLLRQRGQWESKFAYYGRLESAHVP